MSVAAIMPAYQEHGSPTPMGRPMQGRRERRW